MAVLNVALTSVDRNVWSGQASAVIARTVEGDIGILAGHEPYLALLEDGEVRIDRVEGTPMYVAVHGGFFSVDADEVKILVEYAELGEEIDLARAERARDRAIAAGADDPAEIAALRRAESRIDVAMHHQSLTGRM
jgi:F-type H+-transporting ATPase subunit epsilon